MADAWASAILRRDLIFVHAYYQKEPGSLVGTAPYITLTNAASDEQIGKAVSDSLRQPEQELDRPVDGAPAWQATCEALGVTSQMELAFNARVVHVARIGGDLIVTPTDNPGEEKSWNFVHLPSRTIVIPGDASDLEIGEAIKNGWERCS